MEIVFHQKIKNKNLEVFFVKKKKIFILKKLKRNYLF